MDPGSEDLIAALDRLGLAPHPERLAPYATLELGLVPAPAGTSWIGGLPALPHDLAWPCCRWPLAETLGWPDHARAEVDISRDRGQAWVDEDQLVMPLPFLAQVDLAAIAAIGGSRHALPTHGSLAVFASLTSDIADPELAKRVASAVIFVASDGQLRAHPPTYDPPPRHRVALAAERSIAWTIPWEDRDALEAALGRPGLAALTAEAATDRHAVFPAPREELGGPMPPDGEVALLRFVDDEVAGFHCGDASWITFVISELDLHGHRFARARGSVFIG